MIVEAVLGLQIDGEGIHAGKNLPLHLIFAESTIAHAHSIRHAPGSGIKILARTNDLFRQWINVAAQLQQIAHGVVILVAVQPPHHHRFERGVGRHVLIDDTLKERRQLRALALGRLRLILRRHLRLGHRLGRVPRQLDVLQKIPALYQGLEVHLAFLFLRAVAAETMLLHQSSRLDEIHLQRFGQHGLRRLHRCRLQIGELQIIQPEQVAFPLKLCRLRIRTDELDDHPLHARFQLHLAELPQLAQFHARRIKIKLRLNHFPIQLHLKEPVVRRQRPLHGQRVFARLAHLELYRIRFAHLAVPKQMCIAAPALAKAPHPLRPRLALRAQMQLPFKHSTSRSRSLFANGMIIKPLRRPKRYQCNQTGDEQGCAHDS